MATILVIDDEKIVLQMLRLALTTCGHNVDTALDGEEGIQKFDSNRFDLVITDICMPGIDGNGVVQYIRNSDKPAIPVIGISGTPWLVEDNNFDEVIPKPFPIKTLIDTIERVAEKPLNKEVLIFACN